MPPNPSHRRVGSLRSPFAVAKERGGEENPPPPFSFCTCEAAAAALLEVRRAGRGTLGPVGDIRYKGGYARRSRDGFELDNPHRAAWAGAHGLSAPHTHFGYPPLSAIGAGRKVAI